MSQEIVNCNESTSKDNALLDTVKQKHKYKNIITLSSFFAYACTHVTIRLSGDMVYISISIRENLSANQQALHAYANLPSLNITATYRIYSNKRRGAYLIFRVPGAALNRGRRLFILLTATVRGKRKKKVGLVVVYSLHARTEESKECEDFEERTD